MIKTSFLSTAPSTTPSVTIIPKDGWEAAKAFDPRAAQLIDSDWPADGKSRFIRSPGASGGLLLLNLDWDKHSAAKSFKSALKALGDDECESALYVHAGTASQLRQRVWQASDAFYLLDDFLAKKSPSTMKEIVFYASNSSSSMEKEFAYGQHIAAALKKTKTLAEMPSNHCTPSYLGEQALKIAASSPLIEAQVLGRAEIEKIGMHSFLSVSQGSSEEPKFLILSYKPKKPQGEPVVFVGKGITFDTGGNSLKPANSMVGMKFDMSGGATVLGLFTFLAAQSDVSTPIYGLVPSCENIPGGNANKPDDVISSLSGQTIEVLNTDAEGRLILCDALTYAERYNPAYVIDIATLTGSCMATFGGIASGLMGNSPELIEKLKAASETSGDKVWQLPLWDEWHEELKSPIADMANIGSNYSGAITAGCFLEKFAGAYKWAHLDIAGTACSTHGPKRGATGRPIPLLVDFLLQHDAG